MKSNTRKSATFLSRVVVSSLCLVGVSAFVLQDAKAQSQSFLGSEQIEKVSLDPTKPVPRGYIVPKAVAIPGGVRITVDLYQDRVDSPVSLVLQAAVNDGNGKTDVVALKLLSDHLADNPVLYHSARSFDFTYQELNDIFIKAAPAATNLKIGPGTPLFVYANFGSGHQWGGVQRGGIVFMPDDGAGSSRSKVKTSSAVARPTALDVAYPISSTMALPYNDVSYEAIPPGSPSWFAPKETQRGLKIGGQVRSRVESEGKFQIPLDKMDAAKKSLFEIANDPVKAAALLGPDWTLKLEDRYLKRDANQNLVMGADGYPVSEPMVDTYYDNANHDAAKNDMAIRFRSMEKNLNGIVSRDGAWNLKSGQNVYTKEGVVFRVEYGLDATDSRPATIARFANSKHPLNFFKIIPQVIKGSKASDFLIPSVKLTDYRYKFMLHHKSGLAIEVSLDEVHAESMRKQQGRGKVRFGQMEMDVDHMALVSTNVAQASGLLGGGANGASGSFSKDIAQHAAFLATLNDKAFLDGRPALHDASDLKASSPVRITHAKDFEEAKQVIVALRNHVAGKDALHAPQKYAYAASAIGLITAAEQSASVKKLIQTKQEQDKAGKGDGTLFSQGGIADCGAVFN